jgi:hypothetical protein
MQVLERLSLVCKVLLDARLLELCRENEALKLEQKQKTDALKLQVFWLQHDDLKLKQHLAWANDYDIGPNCCCAGCYWNGRFDYVDEPKAIESDVNCTFMPWFEETIVDFGSTNSAGHDHEVTTHFAIDEDGQIDFARWFLHIPTCEHPDLGKVHDLFAHFAGLSGQIEQPGLWERFWTN